LSYGELIRKIRLEKGFSQKEIYYDIVTKSYAIEFEKGNHDLSFKLLLKVLDRLMINLEEFFFIFNYDNKQTKTNWEKFELASNSNDLRLLKQLYEEVASSQKSSDRVFRAMINMRYKVMVHFKETGMVDNRQATVSDIQIVADYLESIQTWTLQEIQLYSNTMGFFKPEQQILFFDNALKKIGMYRLYPPGETIYAKLFINSCGNFIGQGNFTYARKAVAQLQPLTLGLHSSVFKLYHSFFEQVILFCTVEKNASKTAIEQTLQLFDVLGFTYLRAQCFDFFTQIQAIY